MLIGSYLLYLGMLLFSFTLEKHFKLIFTTITNRYIKVLMKLIGSLLLGVSLVVIIKDIGISLGITYWIGALSIIAMLIAFMYTYITNLIIKLSVLFLAITVVLELI